MSDLDKQEVSEFVDEHKREDPNCIVAFTASLGECLQTLLGALCCLTFVCCVWMTCNGSTCSIHTSFLYTRLPQGSEAPIMMPSGTGFSCLSSFL